MAGTIGCPTGAVALPPVIIASVLDAAAAVFAVLTFTPAIRRSDGWSATVTPLASIMGSGFLV